MALPEAIWYFKSELSALQMSLHASWQIFDMRVGMALSTRDAEKSPLFHVTE